MAARSITRDPREYRRGMVLGLTLAETMLLLLFLLMLAAAALLWRANEENRASEALFREAEIRRADAERRESLIEAELRPLIEAFRRQGIDVGSIAEVSRQMAEARAIVTERDQLREARARAETRAGEERAARERAEAALARQPPAPVLRDLLGRAARLDPSRPGEETIAGAVELLERQPEMGRPGAVAAVLARLDRAGEAERLAAEAARRASEAERVSTALQAEIDRLRGQIAARGGGGEIYPSCWVSGRQAEYAFEVVLRNGGQVEVQDLALPARQGQEPWGRLAPFPRGEPIPIETFLGAVRGMVEWSTQQRPECRFSVRVRNGLRPGSPMEEYTRVIGPLGNAASRHLPFYRVGG